MTWRISVRQFRCFCCSGRTFAEGVASFAGAKARRSDRVAAAQADIGLVLARPALERGSLIRVLSGWQLPPRPVMMVTLKREAEPAKVRVVATAVQRHFASLTAKVDVGSII